MMPDDGMKDLQLLSLFINHVVSDYRLKPVHIALSTALCQAWIASRFQRSYHVSRRKLMKASRILSRATYHKALRELQAFGYLEYHPSYHPLNGSSVTLKIESSLSDYSETH
jgi:hypothetical protein